MKSVWKRLIFDKNGDFERFFLGFMNFHASLKPDNEEKMRHVCTRMNKRRIFKQFKKPKRIIERHFLFLFVGWFIKDTTLNIRHPIACSGHINTWWRRECLYFILTGIQWYRVNALATGSDWIRGNQRQEIVASIFTPMKMNLLRHLPPYRVSICPNLNL